MTERRTKGDGGLTQRHDHPSCPPRIDGHRADHRCQGRWQATRRLTPSAATEREAGR